MSTLISWTDDTWNFLNGCTRVSRGCDRCYIERTMPMRITHRQFDKPGIGGTTGVTLYPQRLRQPLSWRRPRRIFVNSMGDTFHDEVPTELIAKAFAVMVAAPQHQFQVLTKRHARMRSLLSSPAFWSSVADELGALWGCPPPAPLTCVPEWIWIGVSVEDQAAAHLRLPALEAAPALTRFVSAEPLLDEVDLSPWMGSLSWVIAGGESGPGARRMDPDWARSLRDGCAASGVAFFMKQAGTVLAREWGCADRTGHNPEEWPEQFPRQYPDTVKAGTP